MNERTRWGVGVRICAGTAWAGVLVVAGLSGLLGGEGGFVVPTPVGTWLGLASVAAGQFVFMTLIADPWLRKANRPMTLAAEAAVFVLFVAALIAAGLGVRSAWPGN